MYYVEEFAQFKSDMNFSAEIYSIPQMNDFQVKTFSLNHFGSKQDVILAKLRVLLHNIDKVAFNESINIKDVANETTLIGLQNCIINRLQILMLKMNKILLDCAIISSNHIHTLESIQSHLNNKINDWRLNVEHLALKKRIELSENIPTLNLSVFADSLKPPLSVILFLSFLKTKGYKVASASYLKKVAVNNKIARINDYLKDNLSINDTRQSYKLILSIIWSKLDIVDCVSQYDINNTPIFGEIMAIIYLCKCLNIEVSKFIIQMESINYDLLYHNNTKRALILLNRLADDINGETAANLALSAFVISCLVHSKSIDKINESLRKNVDSVLKNFGNKTMNFINSVDQLF